MGIERKEKVIEGVLQLVFPRRCPVCHKIAEPVGELVCPACRKKLIPICSPYCKKCGKPIEKEEQEYCFDCAKGKHKFDEGRALYLYDEVMQKSIVYFKFHNRREYAKPYALEMEQYLGKVIMRWEADCLVPVPVHATKRLSRGFNQAEVLAKELSKRTGVVMDASFLKRIKKTLPQKELNDEKRRKNLKNAFQIVKNEVKYKKIILVDDIYTTGSTIDECAEVLKAAGAQQVFFLSLCIGIGYSG